MPNPIALAIPFFFLLMGLELWVAHRRGVKLYRFADVIACLSCGMTQQILLVFEVAVLVASYSWLYQHRLFTLPSWAAWIVAFFVVDFVYYWWHRISHEVNVLWAVHAVHHQSEDYNLAVALRQAVLSVWTIWPFHLPLALLGVPPTVFLIVDSLSTLYQFWIHTELIGTMGWFEWLFNTPAQHRVHHAVNPQYLDKNYAATLCIWDRLFGTFEKEVEKPVYGLVKPLKSFDPMYAQIASFVDLAKRTATSGLQVWLRGPAWGYPPAPSPAGREKHAVQLSTAELWFLSVTLLAALAGTTVLLWNQDLMTLPRKLELAVPLLAMMTLWGFILDRRFSSRKAASPASAAPGPV